MGQGIDGIEPVGNGDFLVTSWSQVIFFMCMQMAKPNCYWIRMNKKRIPQILDMILIKKLYMYPLFLTGELLLISLSELITVNTALIGSDFVGFSFTLSL